MAGEDEKLHQQKCEDLKTVTRRRAHQAQWKGKRATEGNTHKKRSSNELMHRVTLKTGNIKA